MEFKTSSHSSLSTLCSAAWTDVNIDFSKKKLRHCCKSQWENFPERMTVAFINNSERIQIRRKSLTENIEHSDCIECWNSYKLGNSAYRDHKNTWSSAENISTKIKYVELMLDNRCNMSCVYCSPDFSSRIAKENNIVQDFGDLRDADVQIFVQWLESVCAQSKEELTLCFLGGEITFSEQFYKFMDSLLKNDSLRNAKLLLSFLTNGNTPPALFSKFINILDSFPSTWRFDIGVSNESVGTLSELVRWGMNWTLFEKNFRSYLQLSQLDYVVLSPTPCIFTVSSLHTYFEWAFLQIRSHKKKVSVAGNWVENTPLDPAFAPFNCREEIDRVSELFKKNSDLFAFQSEYQKSIKWLQLLKMRIGTSKPKISELNALLETWSTQKGPQVLQLQKFLPKEEL